MSIYAYVGMPGSGKSYDVVANQILPALKSGRTVVTNVPLRLDAVRAVVPDPDVREFPTEQIQASPELIDQYAIPGCVLVLDEVWRLWPAGQKAHQVPEPFRKLLAEHRHMVDANENSTQIVLVTQDLAQIGAFARQLVEQTFYHTKLTHVGASGSYRVDIYQGPQTGPNPPKQARLREIFGRYSKDVFALYESHTQRTNKLDGTGGANEKSADRRGVIWKRPGFILGGVVCVALVAWAVPTIGRVLGGKDEGAQSAASGATGARAVPPSMSRNQAVSVPPRTPWRVSAVQLAGPHSFAVLTDDRGRYRRVPLEECVKGDFTWECRHDGFMWEFAYPVSRAELGQATKPVAGF